MTLIPLQWYLPFIVIADDIFLLVFSMLTDSISYSQDLLCTILKVEHKEKSGGFYAILYLIINLKVNENHSERLRYMSSPNSVINWSKLNQIML